MQAGGRRFDPVILHHIFNIKASWLQDALMLVRLLINKTAKAVNGCSLKIHRVEISVAGGKRTFVKV